MAKLLTSAEIIDGCVREVVTPNDLNTQFRARLASTLDDYNRAQDDLTREFWRRLPNLLTPDEITAMYRGLPHSVKTRISGEAPSETDELNRRFDAVVEVSRSLHGESPADKNAGIIDIYRKLYGL